MKDLEGFAEVLPIHTPMSTPDGINPSSKEIRRNPARKLSPASPVTLYDDDEVGSIFTHGTRLPTVGGARKGTPRSTPSGGFTSPGKSPVVIPGMPPAFTMPAITPRCAGAHGQTATRDGEVPRKSTPPTRGSVAMHDSKPHRASSLNEVVKPSNRDAQNAWRDQREGVLGKSQPSVIGRIRVTFTVEPDVVISGPEAHVVALAGWVERCIAVLLYWLKVALPCSCIGRKVHCRALFLSPFSLSATFSDAHFVTLTVWHKVLRRSLLLSPQTLSA